MLKKIIDTIRGKTKTPENLEECFVWLDRFTSDQKQWSKLDEKSALAQIHSTFGMWIRNEWGLWADSKLAQWFKSKGISHADDMSGIILTSYHRKLNKKEIKLIEQIECYRNDWRDEKK